MGQGRRLRVTRWGAVLSLCVAACGQTTQNRADSSLAGQPASDEPAAAGMPSELAGSAGDVSVAGASGLGSEGGAPPAQGGAAPSFGGEGGSAEPVECSRFVTRVVDHAFGGGQSFNQERFPEPLFGPPDANQPRAVVSLGNGGFVVLGFEGSAIVDGPGPDFTVFENPLPTYRELATVAVSEDGESWHEFPCTATNDGPDYGACAGVALVYSSPSNGVDPLDPEVSGGDAYDLAEVGVSRARFVRITDRADLVGGLADVFDLDAVAIVNAECP